MEDDAGTETESEVEDDAGTETEPEVEDDAVEAGVEDDADVEDEVEDGAGIETEAEVGDDGEAPSSTWTGFSAMKTQRMLRSREEKELKESFGL